jgi:hypothetical protein
MFLVAPLARVLVGLCAASAAAWAQTSAPPDPDLATTLQRAGERVEQFFTRAQTIVSTETVRLQTLGNGLTPDGFARTVESELRLTWKAAAGADASADAQVERRVMKVNGRPPRAKSDDSCTVPEQRTTQTQPLSMLLPRQRQDYVFSFAGSGRADRRAAVMVDFKEVAKVTVRTHIENGNADCIGFDVTGGMRGRLWIDAETFDVLRLDQRLSGLVDVRLPREALKHPTSTGLWTLERLDQTLRFKPIAFQDPDEVLVLPVSSTELSVMQADGIRRLRTTTQYSRYLRMLTGGRLVEDGDRDE